MSTHINQFNKFASSYTYFNHMQKTIAENLLKLNNKKYKTILDLGCGSGEVVSFVDWQYDNFVAVDASTNMCKMHISNENTKVVNANFDKDSFFDSVLYFNNTKKFDCVMSSSSIHWSKDINKLFRNISNITDNVLISALTSNTFKSLHEALNIKSPLQSSKEILNDILFYFPAINHKVLKYTMEFQNTKELLRYIKKTGVSGGLNSSSLGSLMKLINENKLKILEFEVLYVYSKE